MLRNLVTAGVVSTVLGAFPLARTLQPSPREEPGARNEAGVQLFRERVRPLLVAKCLECHGPEKKEGGLDLSRRSAALAGGESGPALVPGEPEQSLAWQLVTAFEMPPDLENLLTPEETAAFKRWIELGAPYDREPLTPAAGANDIPRPDRGMCPCMERQGTGGGPAGLLGDLPRSRPLTQDEAGERAAHFIKTFGNARLQAGRVQEARIAWEVQVVTRDGSPVNWLIVDKRTGRLRLLY